MEWVEAEWDAYANRKWEDLRTIHIEEMRKDGLDPAGFWFNQIFQYANRAQVLGLGNPNGRQAMMKMVATVIDGTAAMIVAHGLPPAPGYSSGELHEWE